jgi:hypothetical protein
MISLLCAPATRALALRVAAVAVVAAVELGRAGLAEPGPGPRAASGRLPAADAGDPRVDARFARARVDARFARARMDARFARVRPGWLGATLEPHREPLEADGRRFARGLRADRVVPGGPADRAGLRPDDVIVAAAAQRELPDDADCGLAWLQRTVSSLGERAALELTIVRDMTETGAAIDGTRLALPRLLATRHLLARHPPGSRLHLVARRRRDVRKLDVRLGTESDLTGTRALSADLDAMVVAGPPDPEEQLARLLASGRGASSPGPAPGAPPGSSGSLLADLESRLAGLHASPDAWRLPVVAAVHRNPLRLPSLARRLRDDLGAPPLQGSARAGSARPWMRLRRAAHWTDRDPGDMTRVRLGPAGATLDERLDEVCAVLERASAHQRQAFASLTTAEMGFLRGHLGRMTRSLTRSIRIERGLTQALYGADLQVLALARRVDLVELERAALVLASFVEEAASGPFREDLERTVRRPEHVRESAFGRVVIGGRGHNRHRDRAAAVIDLGGDDFYSAAGGASAGPPLPVAVVLDYEGDDAYETTGDGAHGCGMLGAAVLCDLAGDDSYLGQNWAQGAGLLGVGVLEDVSGDDRYRAWDFAQGVALFGTGVLADGGGRDSYTATRFAQGCALPGGLGLLCDSGAEGDSYFAKGKHATSYGDSGLFDSFSQGCALGLRWHASGGLALLSDGGGDDRYEAGHFSQGGGYYFGLGVLADSSGDDLYIGSRYAQAFAAHQAAGCLLDAAGDDRYTVRQGVAQAVAWDQSVAALVDGSGDDLYDGGDGGSHAASAHNSCALLFDLGGDDRYQLPASPASAGPNNAHGGQSFSLLIDAGGGHDTHSRAGVSNDTVASQGEIGFFADLPGPVGRTVRAWRAGATR